MVLNMLIINEKHALAKDIPEQKNLCFCKAIAILRLAFIDYLSNPYMYFKRRIQELYNLTYGLSIAFTLSEC